ncbi:MAG: nuclear transport factor 2 family protein [Verrucomicrobiota bacterium]
MTSHSSDPASVVQRQLDAYNARDLDALLTIYSESAELYEHPSTLLASGAAALRERYAARFREPNLYATLLNRTVMGNFVVDHEEVRRTFPEGSGRIRLLMIYEVQAGRIVRAWTLAGERTLD